MDKVLPISVTHTALYIGRFAPSPSGPLHFGSLVCALASYLDAKAHQGRWQVRIEDIDPPREAKGATDAILHTLQCHGLAWDGPLTFQSQHSSRYLSALGRLAQQRLSYPCNCTRKRLSPLKGVYDGHCKKHTADTRAPCAIRLDIEASLKHLAIPHAALGAIKEAQTPQKTHASPLSDCVIHRKDGLFAYQLAVVVDDIAEGVSHIVRGRDLLDTTPYHQLLTQLLDGQPMHYAHIPLITNAQGEKLSKQNHAPALNDTEPCKNLRGACKALGLAPPPTLASTTEILQWAVAHWDISTLS